MQKKKTLRNLLGTALVLSLTVTGISAYTFASESTEETIRLTEEEESIIEAMGEDVNQVARDEFSSIVSAIYEAPEDFTGKVYQVEGIYTMAEGEDEESEKVPYLYQEADGETVGLVMQYLDKEIADGSWVRVTGIISQEEHGEHSHVTFDVVAVESADAE